MTDHLRRLNFLPCDVIYKLATVTPLPDAEASFMVVVKGWIVVDLGAEAYVNLSWYLKLGRDKVDPVLSAATPRQVVWQWQ